MKSLFALLLPWMAAVAVGQQPITAAVVFPNVATERNVAYRVGDECYLPVDSLLAWGFESQRDGAEIIVRHDGRTVRVPSREIASRRTVPLRFLVSSLGGGSEWREQEPTLDVWSYLTAIEFIDGELRISAGLPVRPTLHVDAERNTLIVDILGARLGPNTRVALPRGVQPRLEGRRLRLEFPSRPGMAPTGAQPTLATQHRLSIGRVVISESAPASPVAVAPPVVTPPPRTEPPTTAPPVTNPPPATDPPVTQPPVTDPPVTETPPPTEPPAYVTYPWVVRRENDRELVIVISAKGTPPAPPILERGELTEVVLFVPGAVLVQPEGFAQGDTPSLTSETTADERGVRYRFILPRPYGVEYSVVQGDYVLRMHKPAVGNGRLVGKVVVLDPGHGGHDPGARFDGVSEKTLALSISQRAARHLTAAGATVIMTRSTDVFVPLAERPAIANRNKADFFISVHINSSATPNRSTGTITFYHKQDPIGRLLAECLHREIVKTSGLPNIGVWSDQRIYNSGFAVLRGAQVPAVLLELGFINHSTDRRVMQTEKFQEAVAAALVEGLKVYLGDGS